MRESSWFTAWIPDGRGINGTNVVIKLETRKCIEAFNGEG